LYSPKRVDAYLLKADGATPEETVAASQIEGVEIPVNAQVTLGAAFIHGAARPPRGRVLYFHGQGGNVDNSLAHAKRFANMGFDTLVFDYRGWGTSTNLAPTEAGIDEDTRAARAYLVQRAGTDDGLIYYGISFGTAAATQRAVSEPPTVLILEAGFASIEEMGRDSSDMDLPSSFIASDTWATSTRIASVRSPVLFIHGLADDYVRPEFSQTLFDRANEPKKLVFVEGAKHAQVARGLGEKYAPMVLSFVEDHLP
jgi:fermentation-respiration switch protein FrsA (DUF1100 family)